MKTTIKEIRSIIKKVLNESYGDHNFEDEQQQKLDDVYYQGSVLYGKGDREGAEQLRQQCLTALSGDPSVEEKYPPYKQDIQELDEWTIRRLQHYAGITPLYK